MSERRYDLILLDNGCIRVEKRRGSYVVGRNISDTHLRVHGWNVIVRTAQLVDNMLDRRIEADTKP